MTKIASALLEVLERHRAFADADALVQRGAARFVAHVRAVGQIVRAELPREKLPEKRRLVARRGPRCRTPPRPASASARSSRAISANASSHEIGS